MGALFLCLSPALYCNVSDAWTLPNKWHRIIISAAGIYVELVIAAIATFIWWYTPTQPFINNLSLSLMIVCSVSTVVFNANPLMRYDGYYILADWIEIPNLRDRSNRFLMKLVQEHCLGIEVQPEGHMELVRRILFVAYAVVSWVYRWVVTFSILYFLYMFLKPYKLGAISALLAIAAGASMVGWPLYRLGKNLYKRGRLPDMKPQRVTVSVGALAAVVLFFFLVPLPVARVRQAALVQVQPEAGEHVHVQVPGILKALYVTDGQYVPKDYVLAEFTNVEVENEFDETQAKLDAKVAEYNALSGKLNEPGLDPADASKLQKQRAEAAGERSRLQTKRDDYLKMKELLILKAPREGRVMSPPQKDEVGKQWDKERTQPFCTIGEPKQLWVLTPVSTSDYRLLKDDREEEQRRGKDLSVDLRVQGLGGKTWKGKIAQLPESEAKEVPLALTIKAGGPVAVKPSTQPNVYVPQNQQYLLGIDIVDADDAIRPGTLAQVKVHCRWRTCAWWVWRTVSSTFDLGLL
jgi:putative peptide zinc metalloprotease protein